MHSSPRLERTPVSPRIKKHKTLKEIPDSIRPPSKHHTYNIKVLNEEQAVIGRTFRYLTPTNLLLKESPKVSSKSPDLKSTLSIVQLLQLKSTTKVVPKFRQLELVGKNFLSPLKSPSSINLNINILSDIVQERKNDVLVKKSPLHKIPSHIVKSSSWKAIPSIVKKKKTGMNNELCGNARKGVARNERNLFLEVPEAKEENRSFSLNGWEDKA